MPRRYIKMRATDRSFFEKEMHRQSTYVAPGHSEARVISRCCERRRARARVLKCDELWAHARRKTGLKERERFAKRHGEHTRNRSLLLHLRAWAACQTNICEVRGESKEDPRAGEPYVVTFRWTTQVCVHDRRGQIRVRIIRKKSLAFSFGDHARVQIPLIKKKTKRALQHTSALEIQGTKRRPLFARFHEDFSRQRFLLHVYIPISGRYCRVARDKIGIVEMFGEACIRLVVNGEWKRSCSEWQVVIRDIRAIQCETWFRRDFGKIKDPSRAIATSRQ